MRPLDARPIILAMNPLPKQKLLLIADRRETARASAPQRVRRYRLARLRADGAALEDARQFEYLKRTYD